MSDTVEILFRLTPAGSIAIWNAKRTGVMLDLTHLQMGDANADNWNVTDLHSPQQYVPFAAGFQVTDTQIRLSAILRGNTQYLVREIGLWAGEPGAPGSVLVFYWAMPSGELAAKYPNVDFIFSHEMTLLDAVPAGSINIIADPGQSALLAMIMAHEQNPNAHQAYVDAIAALNASVFNADCLNAALYFERLKTEYSRNGKCKPLVYPSPVPLAGKYDVLWEGRSGYGNGFIQTYKKMNDYDHLIVHFSLSVDQSWNHTEIVMRDTIEKNGMHKFFTVDTDVNNADTTAPSYGVSSMFRFHSDKRLFEYALGNRWWTDNHVKRIIGVNH